MCGIAGEVRWDAAPAAGAEEVLSTVLHRGPDSLGAFSRDDAWVGQTRLAIIDVPGGDPPIASEDGSIGVALNGEIYNFRELRAELRERGHEFATGCDTEVVVHLAEELDPVALARRLEGMFAVAVWDAPRRRLVLARDRFGKKPLYYWHDATRLVFGSEIKAVLANPAVPRRLRAEAIPDYLTFGYVPTPDTFYEGIRSVPPGHVLVAEDGAPPRIEPYWRLGLPGVDGWRDAPGAVLRGGRGGGPATAARGGPPAARRGRPARRVSQRRHRLVGRRRAHGRGRHRSRRSRSASTTATASTSARMRARSRAATAPTTPSSSSSRMPPSSSRSSSGTTTSPSATPARCPTYLLSELTAGHVKVALCGDGGDELFGGYERFAAARALARYEAVPDVVRTAVRRGAHRAAPLAQRSKQLAKARRALLRSDRGPADGLLAWVSYVSEESKAALVGAAESPGMDAYRRIWAQSAGAHPLDRLLDLNIRTYLLDDLLPKVDRMSMAHGLEVRAPFLDRELAELAFRLPPCSRLRGFQLKRVLKAAVADLLPPELLKRPKQGFGVPLDRWFREDLAPLVGGTLGAPDSRVGEHVSRDAVRAMLSDHARGNEPRSRAVDAADARALPAQSVVGGRRGRSQAAGGGHRTARAGGRGGLVAARRGRPSTLPAATLVVVLAVGAACAIAGLAVSGKRATDGYRESRRLTDDQRVIAGAAKVSAKLARRGVDEALVPVGATPTWIAFVEWARGRIPEDDTFAALLSRRASESQVGFWLNWRLSPRTAVVGRAGADWLVVMDRRPPPGRPRRPP